MDETAMNELRKNCLKQKPENIPTANIGEKLYGCGIILEKDKTNTKQTTKKYTLKMLLFLLIF